MYGCNTMSHIPTSRPLHDDHITLVKENVDIGNQKIYKNEQLKHYVINGVDSYCLNVITTNTSLYRCFALENNKLTKGLNPQSEKWETLNTPILIITK